MQTKKTMKTATKALLLSLCAVVLVAASVLGTLAYLTSQDSVVNTFTVGDVKITLDETDVDAYGVKDGETRVKANEYKLIPGHTYLKDPTVHVATDSEAAWLFVIVNNGISAIETKEAAKTIETQMKALNWEKMTSAENTYAYKTTVAGGTNVPVFGNFTIDSALQSVAAYEDAEITITAIAVQADGFATAAEAWAAYIAQSAQNA